MEYTLVDGRSAPEPGDKVRVRVLRSEEGAIAVDRPHRDYPLELSADGEVVIPDARGTYEVRGTVSRVMLADRDGADFLFLDDQDVVPVSDGLVELPADDTSLGWEDTDAGDTGVDVDVESVMAEDTVVEESGSHSRGTLGEAEPLSDSMNELLLK